MTAVIQGIQWIQLGRRQEENSHFEIDFALLKNSYNVLTPYPCGLVYSHFWKTALASTTTASSIFPKAVITVHNICFHIFAHQNNPDV